MLTLYICNAGRVVFDGPGADFRAVEFMKRKPHLTFYPDDSYDPQDFPLVDEVFNPSCEHGLSLSLCAGPNHYPMDNQF